MLKSKSRNESSNKLDISSKKSFQKHFSKETIPRSLKNKENNKSNKIVGIKSEKTSKFNEIQNNYFINLTKNIYADELHMKKSSNMLRKSHNFNNNSKYPNISDKSLINNKSRRMSMRDINLFLPLFNMKKDQENKNTIKDELNQNMKLQTLTLNKKMKEKIRQLLENRKFTNEEKEILLNYYINKNKDNDNIHKNYSGKGSVKSPILKKKKKKKKKDKTIKFKNEIKPIEDEKTEKEIIDNNNTENKENKENNLKSLDKIHKTNKINYLKGFLCCLNNK